MIRLISWIFMISLVFMASSHTTFETGSTSLLNASTFTVSPNESENHFSEIPLTSSNESSSAEADSHPKAGMKAATNQDFENTSPVIEVTYVNKPISMSLKTHVPEPAYLGETSTAFHSTITSLKESVPEEMQQETSSPSHTDKNLYYDSRTTTEYGISHEMSADSPDLISDDFTEKTTPLMTLISEQTKQVADEEIKETVADDHENVGTKPGRFLNDNVSETAPTEHESKAEYTGYSEVSGISFNSQNQKATTEVGNLNEKKIEDLAFEESSRTFFEKSTPNMEETSFAFVKPTEQSEDALEIFNPSEESRIPIEVSTDKELFTTTDHIIPHINNFENMSADATETNINATRNPKRIQGGDPRYSDVIDRVRPLYPDPINSPRSPVDTVRPYRPDTPLYKYPYHRPTPDNRTPINREDQDNTQTPKSGYQYQRVTFKPNYSYSKPSQNGTSSSSTSDSNASKPHRPSLSHPYVPQGSFGRPYRPDFHKPASKPADEYPLTTKPVETKGASSQDSVDSEHSRVDYDYTRLSETVSGYTRPSPLRPEFGKPYRPTYNTEIYNSKPSSPEIPENRDSVKVSKPDMVSNRPYSFIPRPGFGNKYQNPDLSLRPFSAGTISSSRNLTRVEYIKADCFDNHMKVTMRFNGTFSGLVYSSGYAQDAACSYVNGSGRNHYEFYIRLNRCGTLGQQEVTEERLRSRRRQERAQYLVNTVTVQYSQLIEEDIDEHFRVTCEYGYDFWKTVSFPIINVESSAVKVRDGNPVVFTLPPPQCNMEVRLGSGPSGARVSGPVNVGDPLTLVIHMKSESSGFDILVSNCVAHNGANRRITLIDSHGCVADERMVSPFKGTSYPDRSQQVTLYSYLKAFRFTGSPALYIECDVRMCHGSCPPQRCYWRHLYKRSAEEIVEESTTATSSYISDSISLYQALEVRHDEADLPYLLALHNKDELDLDNTVCMRAGGFAAMLAGLLVLLFTTILASVVMCIRMRKMKKFMQGPDVRRFVEFDGRVPRK